MAFVIHSGFRDNKSTLIGSLELFRACFQTNPAPGSNKIGIFGMSAKSDAEREPGFRKNHRLSGKFILATFRASPALKVAEIILSETQRFNGIRVRALHPILLAIQGNSL